MPVSGLTGDTKRGRNAGARRFTSFRDYFYYLGRNIQRQTAPLFHAFVTTLST